MSTPDADAVARGDVFESDEKSDTLDDLPENKPEVDKVDAEVDKAATEVDKDKAEEKVEDKAEEKPKKDTRIPLSRHEALLAKERERREAAERQVAQYQNSTQVAKTNEDLTKLEDNVLEMEGKYNKLMADGEVEKARELMTKIRQTERSIIKAQSDAQMAIAMAQAAESARYSIALERIEEAYPELNEDHDDYDAEKMADVADLKAVYMRRGMTPTQALQKAVLKFFPKTESKAQEAATTVAPRVSEKDVAAERKKLAANKAADAVTRQPASTSKAGTDNTRTVNLTAEDVIKLPQDKFAKLDEAELAKLRGDIL